MNTQHMQYLRAGVDVGSRTRNGGEGTWGMCPYKDLYRGSQSPENLTLVGAVTIQNL